MLSPGDENLYLTKHLELIASELILINPKFTFVLWPLSTKPATSGIISMHTGITY